MLCDTVRILRNSSTISDPDEFSELLVFPIFDWLKKYIVETMIGSSENVNLFFLSFDKVQKSQAAKLPN